MLEQFLYKNNATETILRKLVGVSGDYLECPETLLDQERGNP